MTTPLSDERDLTNIDRLRIGALHVEPPFADEDLLDEITALESELERLRARVAELEEQDDRWQVMVDRMAGQSADNLMRAQAAERRVAELVAVLRSVEWGTGTYVYDDDGGRMIPTCPRCLSTRNDGHYSDCALDAALRNAHD